MTLRFWLVSLLLLMMVVAVFAAVAAAALTTCSLREALRCTWTERPTQSRSTSPNSQGSMTSQVHFLQELEEEVRHECLRHLKYQCE